LAINNINPKTYLIMANVTFMDGIATIRGKLGDTIYRRTASGKTIAYKAPERVCRKATPAEQSHRNRFALIVKMVSIILGDPSQRAAYEQLQGQIPSAKSISLRKFVFQQVSAALPHPKASLPRPKS
jgi:hypothetical protein